MQRKARTEREPKTCLQYAQEPMKNGLGGREDVCLGSMARLP